MKIRIGCLTLLFIFAVSYAIFVWTDDEPSDLAGGPAVMGLMALIVIYAGNGIEQLTTRKRPEARGFPIETIESDRKE